MEATFKIFKSKNKLLKLIFIALAINYSLISTAQLASCDAIVPYEFVDLRGNPDSVWYSPDHKRNGICCGNTSDSDSNQPVRCTSFEVYLDENVAMINFEIFSGAEPPGALYYQVDCGPKIFVGTPICISGSGPHQITFCKPGGNSNVYRITSISKPVFPKDDTTRVGCSLPLNIYGIKESSITINAVNSSVGTSNLSLYNNLLSCVDCLTPSFTPGSTTPLWIDYEMCGSPTASLDCGPYFDVCETVRLYTMPALNISVTPNPGSFCFGSTDGVVLVASATGGDSNYTYEWRLNNIVVGTGNTYTALAEGSYVVEVNDGLSTGSCPGKPLSVPVSVGNQPEVTVGADQYLCAEKPTATIIGDVKYASGGIWSGGNGTFSPSNTAYLINYTPTQTELNAGSVTLTLTSTGAGGGCDNASASLTLYYSDTLNINVSISPISCFGETGTISVSPTGGTIPLTYLWSTGETTNTFINVTAGAYSFALEDAYGCRKLENYTIVQPDVLFAEISTTETSTDIACDGSAQINFVTGGTAPFTYLWDNGSTTSSVTNLCYGIVRVTITDANGCVYVGSAVVNNQSCLLFNASATNTNVLCFGDANAEATAVAVGAITPYAYVWNTTPQQSTQTATGLSAGAYTVTVTSDNGCIDLASVLVTQPAKLTNTISHIDAISIGGSEGSATANPSGGTPGYYYEWTPNGQTTQTATGLSAGVYYLDLEDENNCAYADSVKINEPPCNDFVLGVNKTDITCNGDNNGAASLVILNGTAPFEINWFNTHYNVGSVSNLSPGIYNVEVRDALKCTTFQNFEILEPAALSIALVSSNVTCNGRNDGTVDLTVGGGTFPYYYNWTYNGKFWDSVEDLMGLYPGTYDIAVYDDNKCSITGSIAISQPSALNYTIDNVSDVVCYGESNGSISVTSFGGIKPYTFNWSSNVGFSANTEDISGLGAGRYEFTLTDANNCVFTPRPIYINQPDSIVIWDAVASCPAPGSTTVTVNVNSISGGTESFYEISYDNGINYGSIGDYTTTLTNNNTYYLLAKDANGCVSTNPYELIIDDNVTIANVSFDPCISVGNTTASVTVTVQGGDGGAYQISTNNGTTFSAAGTYTFNLAVNNSYTILAKDGKGCISESTTIYIPAPYSASASVQKMVTCAGGSDGEINLSVSGGLTPYSFNWSGPSFSSTNQNLTNLFAGNYFVTVTDNNNCDFNTSITLNTVVDITNPVITCHTGNRIETSDNNVCTYTVTDMTWDATATDNCLLSTLTYSLTGATSGTGTSLQNQVFELGVTTVTWTATDGAGNTAMCSYTVQITDNQKPSLTSCGATGTQNVFADNGACTYTHSDLSWDATADDNCTVSTLTYTLTGATTGSGNSLENKAFNLGATTVT
jgi:large repetitive protein